MAATDMKQVFTYDNLVHAVSGAVGSSVAISVFYPLDTARTRLQIQDHTKPQFSGKIIARILREEGLEALYRGWYPVVTSLWCSNFVYFYVYNSLKALSATPGKHSNLAKDLLLAYVAGATNVLTTTPLWVVNTRLKIQGVKTNNKKSDDEENHTKPYRGIADCFRRIVREEGVSSLWSGVSPSLVLALNPAIQWMVYEALKRYLQKKFGIRELSGWAYFTGGAIAKIMSTILTYPMQVVQTRLRAGHHQRGKSDMRLLEVLLDIVRMKGFLGMYKGLEAKLTQTVLMSALMFLTYEKIAAFVFSLMGRNYSSAKTR